MNKTQLTRHQKEAIGLLSFGTFLEYFDLMLYVHMAVLLNELFFPKTNDPYLISLYAALAFCSNYIFRPFGALIIGWIGDKIGRKVTVMITSFTMAIACIVIATTKTYAEIGIAATIIITICRMLQGFSSMGEITGAWIYCSESFQSPLRYSMSTLVAVFSRLGGLFALVVALIAVNSNFSWRFAFLAGAMIALVGFVARTRLRETAEFADFKRRMRNKAEQSGQDIKIIENLSIYKEKINLKAALSYFMISIPGTLWRYIAYIYAAVILKNIFGFNAKEIIMHNFAALTFGVLSNLMYAYLVNKIHPLKITKYRSYLIFLFLPFIPYYLNNLTAPWEVMLLQILVLSIAPESGGHLDSLCYKYFPIAKRFTAGALIFGIAYSLGYVLSSFGFVYIMHCFGNYGVWVYTTPILVAYVFAINYIKKLEIKNGSYHDYPNEVPGNEDTALKEEEFDYELGNEYEPFKGACQYSIQLLSKLDAVGREMDKKINIKLVEKAIIFAKYWHDEQIRKVDNSPYYSHPLMVAGTVAEHCFKTDMIIAAILHDVVEDSECTVEIIEREFNARIAQIVDRLTNIRDIDGKKSKITLEQMIKKICEAGDYEAVFIKNCDRTHNLETIEGLMPEKQQKMARETNNYLVGMVAIVAEKLGIHNKVYLENKLFKLAHNILKK